MRINDHIGEAFPAGGCTAYACEIASRFHGLAIADPLCDPEFLAAAARGDDLRVVSGCRRVEPPLQLGDIVVYGRGGRQHMGVVGEDGYVLHAQLTAKSILTPLAVIATCLISAWRPEAVPHG